MSSVSRGIPTRCDNWGNGQNKGNILTRALKEYNAMKGSFTYLRCWEILRGSPKWSNVPTMTSSGRHDDEDLELERPPGRRSDKNKGKKEFSSSSNPEILKQDFEEMNRRLQDIRDLGHRRLQTMEERNSENKKFVALQESRQMENHIEFLSKPIDHLTDDAMILSQMRRQQIRQKYGL
ncbi:uncharacterized protein LOC110932175 [Helianthus annuus]|uniref:uncharacterized protein LOC110932175 n=1 Tax=Helianthus annuus TaxID=4232 RepID=UPI000B8F5D3B|nr:uncharacterized protein LOC110932175 [Helianthus annuus]